MSDVTLYSTGCPKCKVLEKKLSEIGVDFVINSNVDDMRELGFRQAPMLKVNNEIYNFFESMELLSTDGLAPQQSGCETCSIG